MVEVETTLIAQGPAVSAAEGGPAAPAAADVKVFYFAVGPYSHEITCPFCQAQGKTKIKNKWLRGYRQHYCSSCGEYLGVFRRTHL